MDHDAHAAGEKSALRVFLNDVWLRGRALRRAVQRVDARLVSRHLAADGPNRLHVGCGMNVLDGWLNCDLVPVSDDIVALDATRPLPFADGTFDHVFSEHMIEHVAYRHGVALLRECMRVLRPGGRLRVATPDMAFVVGLYGQERSELQDAYVRWSKETFLGDVPAGDDVFVINNFVRDWGHTFVYDERVLRDAMERAGFRDVVRREVGESDDPALRGLESEDRLPEGFYRLETMVLEGAR